MPALPFLSVLFLLSLLSLLSAPLLRAQNPQKEEVFRWNEDNPSVMLEEARPMDELNRRDQGDAYPWISADGLRLYYTVSDYALSGTRRSGIFTASRSRIDQPFSNVRLVVEGADKRSGWLTHDESELYYTDGTDLYRMDMTGPFPDDPDKILLNGLDEGYVAGPSFSRDKSELYLFQVTSGIGMIMILERTGSDEYDMVGTLDVPSEYTASPGQLSKDDLRYYCALKDLETRELRLACYYRRSVEEPFGPPVLLRGAVEGVRRLHQPSVSADDRILVFVGNNVDTWDSTDLYMALDPLAGVDKPMKVAGDRMDLQIAVIALMPVLDRANVLLSGPLDVEGDLVFYGSNGNEVLRLSLDVGTGERTVDLSLLGAGEYICRIETSAATGPGYRMIRY